MTLNLATLFQNIRLFICKVVPCPPQIKGQLDSQQGTDQGRGS